MSLLVLSEVLGLFLNTFFFQFYAAFLNFTSTFEHFEKKKKKSALLHICFRNYRLQKMRLLKCLKSPV